MFNCIDSDKFQKLIEINSLINSNYADPGVLLQRILESATVLTKGESSSLLLTNTKNNTLYFEIALGPKSSDIKKYSLAMGEGIAGWVALHKKSLIVNDTDTESRYFSDIGKKIGYKSTSILAVPLKVQNQCLGVIEIINKENKDHFNEEDLQWLEIFANQAAIAMQNSNNFQDIKNELALMKKTGNYRDNTSKIIYKSSKIRDLINLSIKMSRSESTILIEGESGVGKELFAELIKANSQRANKPFIQVNCAAIPAGLIENELFGHEKGAFTDASSYKRGYFELAEGGTILLDEIGEMPLEVQSKLLRVLQQKEFVPVGSSITKKADVRILSSTNKSLKALVDQGLFRKDLYYRINVLPLKIPPLRERREDIIILAEYFLKLYTADNQIYDKSFSKGALLALERYNWPGNIRELQNVIERSIVTSTERTIYEENFFIIPETDRSGETVDRSFKDAINDFKRDFIIQSLRKNKWNQTETAKLLKIQRTYLSKLIKEYEIVKE